MSDDGNATGERTAKPLVIYIQYTNPAGYPPLEHSSRILAGLGWNVIFLGASADGADMLAFPKHPAITVRRLPGFGLGLPQRLNYACFILWTLMACLWHRPRWIYASDPLSCPAALIIQRIVGCKVIYHEHDSPTYSASLSRVQRLVQNARTKLARNADLCVLPQEKRLAAFVTETGRTGPVECVWNCPRRDEVAAARERKESQPITFYYHGSINQERFPLSILDALKHASPAAKLAYVGYETAGSRGYVAQLRARAAELGLTERVRYLGPLSRSDMMANSALGDVGLAFMPLASRDINMSEMTGASNKPFDYLAMGQMLLVSILPDWRTMFVAPGYALACDPYDQASLGAAMHWCANNPDAVRSMGETGRQRIFDDWNYERCFAPVAERMTGVT
jgi:glycosyltransferase involved in cell wall biosynthesis